MSEYNDLEHVKRHAQAALSQSNARAYDGDDNYKKKLVITTCVTGPYSKDAGGFVLEAKVPRSAVNDLGLSATWITGDRGAAAAFLRSIADEIERGS
jgi:hypothetical protein